MEVLGGLKALENVCIIDNSGGPLEAPFGIILVFFVGLVLLDVTAGGFVVPLLVLIVVLVLLSLAAPQIQYAGGNLHIFAWFSALGHTRRYEY